MVLNLFIQSWWKHVTYVHVYVNQYSSIKLVEIGAIFPIFLTLSLRPDFWGGNCLILTLKWMSEVWQVCPPYYCGNGLPLFSSLVHLYLESCRSMLDKPCVNHKNMPGKPPLGLHERFGWFCVLLSEKMLQIWWNV